MVRFVTAVFLSAVATAKPHQGQHADVAKELKLLQTEIKAQQAEIKDIKQASQKTEKLLLNLGRTFNEVPSFLEKQKSSLPPNCYIMTAIDPTFKDVGTGADDTMGSIGNQFYPNVDGAPPFNGAVRCNMFDEVNGVNGQAKDFENTAATDTLDEDFEDSSNYEWAKNPGDCPVQLCYKYGWLSTASSESGVPGQDPAEPLQGLIDYNQALSVYQGHVDDAKWSGDPWAADGGAGLLGWDGVGPDVVKDEVPRTSDFKSKMDDDLIWGTPKGDPRLIGFHSTGDTGQLINYTEWIQQHIASETDQVGNADHRRAKFLTGSFPVDYTDATEEVGVRQMWHTRCQVVPGYMDEDTHGDTDTRPTYSGNTADEAYAVLQTTADGPGKEFYNGMGAYGSSSRCLCCLDNSFTEDEFSDGTPIGDQAGGVY